MRNFLGTVAKICAQSELGDTTMQQKLIRALSFVCLKPLSWIDEADLRAELLASRHHLTLTARELNSGKKQTGWQRQPLGR
jgi:hypothetical protein